MTELQRLSREMFVVHARLAAEIEATAGVKAQPESCASDCSADGRRIKQGEASVQPGGPSQTLEKLKTLMEKELASWRQLESRVIYAPPAVYIQNIIYEYMDMLSIIEGEAGVVQDERSRPAG